MSLPPLPDGVYTVQWHAFIIDEDEADGAYIFAIGTDIPADQPVILQTTPEDNETGFPVGWIVAAGVLVVALLAAGLIWRRQSSS